MNDITQLDDKQVCDLVQSRWDSSSVMWKTIDDIYTANLAAYRNESKWLKNLPEKRSKVRDNRIFVNSESVINSIIANPPKPIIIPGRDTESSKRLAMDQEKYFQNKYTDRNVKETIRKGLRNLYLSRIVVLKPFWDTRLNDFNLRTIDARNVRFSKSSTKEDESEFAIEKITDNVNAIVARFPQKKDEIMKEAGSKSFFGLINDDKKTFIDNPEVEYYEAWIGEYVIYKFGNIILSKERNPYWDFDGIQITEDEHNILKSKDTTTDMRRSTLTIAKTRAFSKSKEAPVDNLETKERAYKYNHFDIPRKPYIFATIFNNENTPIGQTDFITQAIPLQEDIDETKRNITENARIMNGVIKVDSTVMTQGEAKKLAFETGGIIYGKGVHTGVTRETGAALPAFIQMNLDDSRKAIDDIMAASSAFRGVREGQETRGGRLALIDQSFLRLNELVQVIDYLNNEVFNWWYQLAKVNYTEHHYSKTMGHDRAAEILTLTQDDFEDGTEIRVIGGKTLPEDRQFKYEQAQKDLELGVLSPIDYLAAAGYDNPAEKARNKVAFDLNKPLAVGITQDELAIMSPPPAVPEDAPKLSIGYMDLPPDGKVQMAAKSGIILDPALVIAEALKVHDNNDKAKSPVSKPKT